MTSEMSRMSFELAKHSVNRSMSLDRRSVNTKQELLVDKSMKMNYSKNDYEAML